MYRPYKPYRISHFDSVHIAGRQALNIGSRPCSVTFRPVDVASSRNTHLAIGVINCLFKEIVLGGPWGTAIGRYDVSVGDLSFYPKGVKHGGK